MPKTANSRLEQKFSALLDQLGLEVPKGFLRPAAREQRVAEEILEAFLDNSGEQLIEILKEGQGASRAPQEIALHQLEAVISLFYSAINDIYIGVDSHPPSRFLEVHPFLLDNLAESESESENGTDEEHRECHAPRLVRIVPFSVKELQDDYDAHPGIAKRYFNLHEGRVTLLQVEPHVYTRVHNEVLQGEWTGDLGLWINTCALLFEPVIKETNKRLRLELLYPHDKRFETYLSYVQQLVAHASRVKLHGKEVRSEKLAAASRDHLNWNLEMMFQPELADAWREFVSPSKRIAKLGPFIEKQIATARITEPKILDAATGVGSESLYLAGKGYDVTANEIDHRLISHCHESAEKSSQEPLDIKRFDWRHFHYLADTESFNVLLALGNSLSCLSSMADVRSVLRRFAFLLRPDGLLIIDERNYPAMFTQRKQMRHRDFRFPGNVIYCSKTIQARPKAMPEKAGVDKDMLTLEYIRSSDGKPVGTFEVLPFDKGQLKGLLEETGFHDVKEFYNLGNRKQGAQFVTYVASRTYDVSEFADGREIETVVAFTDVSQSTNAKKELGEEKYAEEWRKHEQRVTKLVRKSEGKIVNSTGDGFLLEFKDPETAVECLSAIVNEGGDSQLVIRAGVTRGRAMRDKKGNLRGHDVDIAARICDAARPNLVVADDRIMLKLSERQWGQLGPVELRGVGEVPLWRLDD